MTTKLKRETWMKHELPYGKWTGASGREVLFNRQYQPILERDAAGHISRADRGEWVSDITKQRWYCTDKNSPWLSKVTLRKLEAIMSGYTWPEGDGANVPLLFPITTVKPKLTAEMTAAEKEAAFLRDNPDLAEMIA